MKSILIQNAYLVNPSKKQEGYFDILIENGKFKAIDKKGSIPIQNAECVINADKHWVTPGLIDVHVHLREPGLEYKETIETGTKAAVAGGFTSVACMANTNPVNDNPYITSYIREKAKQSGHCRVFPIGAVSKGLLGQELADIGGMVKEGIVALSDDGMPVMNSYLMRKAMEYAKNFNLPVISHAEDINLVAGGVVNESALSFELGLKGNPAAAEEIMVAREIALCRLTGARTHIAHLSTKIGLDHFARAKEQGLNISAEASPHHLLFDETCVKTYDTNFKMAPPLRRQEDIAALCAAIENGVIDIIATDHAPHGEVDKMVEFDLASNGVIGLQTAAISTLKLVHDKKISLSRWVSCFTVGPAKLLNLNLGVIDVGFDADVTIINPEKRWSFTKKSILSKSCNSPFINHEFVGKVSHTIVGGQIKYKEAQE